MLKSTATKKCLLGAVNKSSRCAELVRGSRRTTAKTQKCVYDDSTIVVAMTEIKCEHWAKR